MDCNDNTRLILQSNLGKVSIAPGWCRVSGARVGLSTR
jgi:hypothetical protein